MVGQVPRGRGSGALKQRKRARLRRATSGNLGNRVHPASSPQPADDHAAIRGELGLARSTVSRCLQQEGLGLLAHLDRPEQASHFQRDGPGGLINLQIKKLGRFDRPGHSYRHTAGLQKSVLRLRLRTFRRR